jgi:hypothetical protein
MAALRDLECRRSGLPKANAPEGGALCTPVVRVDERSTAFIARGIREAILSKGQYEAKD